MTAFEVSCACSGSRMMLVELICGDVLLDGMIAEC
jgi:hypothetical protein